MIRLLLAFLAAVAACWATAGAATAAVSSTPAGLRSLGAPGEPVTLVVGYQPYYVPAWSALVLRAKRFHERYLPKGTTVVFEALQQGARIADGLQAGSLDVGYLDDLPALAAASRPQDGNLRLVAVLGLGQDRCNMLLVRRDGPSSLQELASARVAAPARSCADRFARDLLQSRAVTPAAYMGQHIELLASQLRTGRIDAAAVWEPMATRLVQEGAARRLLTGHDTGQGDGAFLAMRAPLLERRPDIARAWLQAELDAQRYLADPANAEDIVRLVQAQTAGFDAATLWNALYAAPSSQAAEAPRMTLPFVFDDAALQVMRQTLGWLHANGARASAALPPSALVPELARSVLQERGLASPVGQVMPQPPRAPGQAPAAQVQITVREGGWGTANTRDVRDVLTAVARELQARVPGRPLAPIVVVHSTRAPLSLYERGPGGAYQVQLTARDEQWAAYVYEFAHELCHVLGNYERHPHLQSAGAHRWFEEALCEVSSLYTLHRLAADWAQSPPSARLGVQAQQLQAGADRFLAERHRQLPPGQSLADWYARHAVALRANPYDRDRNEVVANQLLPLFEESPALWEALGYLNLDAPGGDFADYLRTWRDNAPPAYLDSIGYVMALFFGPATARELARGDMELLVPYGLGSGPDGIARRLARLMAPSLGMDVNIANVPGASGNTGLARMLERGDPARSMAVLSGNSVWVWAGGAGTLGPQHFEVLGVVSNFESFLFVPSDSPFRSLQQLLDFATAHPDRLRVASSGAGGRNELALRALGAHGARLINVPVARHEERVAAVLSHRLDLLLEEPGDVAELLAQGRLRPLAVLAGQRDPAFPDVPAAQEAGLDLRPFSSFRALVVPAGSPPEQAQRLRRALEQALRSPSWREYCERLHACADPLSPEATRDYLQRYHDAARAYRARLGG